MLTCCLSHSDSALLYSGMWPHSSQCFFLRVNKRTMNDTASGQSAVFTGHKFGVQFISSLML